MAIAQMKGNGPGPRGGAKGAKPGVPAPQASGPGDDRLPAVSPAVQALMLAGAANLAQARRQRDAFDDLCMLQQVKESGAYVTALEMAGVDSGGAPWRAYCQLIGQREKTVNERLAALNEFGEDAMRAIISAGLPHTGIRALLTAPKELERQLKTKGEMTYDDLRLIVDKIEAERQRSDRERERADRERKRADKAEKESAQRADRIAEINQDLRDAQAEAKVLREQKKNVNVEDVKRIMGECRKAFDRMTTLLGMVDPLADRVTAAEFVGDLEKLSVAIQEEIARVSQEMLG